MSKIAIAAVSMPAPPDKQKNLQTYLASMEKASKKGVKLIVFPEYSLPGICEEFTLSNTSPKTAQYLAATAERVPDGPSVQTIIEAAKKYDMHVVFGMTEQDEVRPDYTYNTAVLVGPEGYIGKHRKIHLTGTERLLVMSGHELNVYDTKIGRIGLLICNDKTFPETSRALKIAGAEIIACCTCWPGVNRDLGENDPMVKIHSGMGSFRALENTLVFVDANLASDAGEVPCLCGHSHIVGPMETDLAATGWDADMAVAELDVQQTIKAGFTNLLGGAVSYSSLRDLRPDVYLPFYEQYVR
jgi:predicted amidohydrolase